MDASDAAANPDLQAAFEDLVGDWPDVTSELLFGYRAYRAGETVFAVLDADGVALTRMPAASRTQLAGERETGPFEAYGQTIDSWIHVPVSPGDLESLAPFVRESYDRARSGTASVPPPADGESEIHR